MEGVLLLPFTLWYHDLVKLFTKLFNPKGFVMKPEAILQQKNKMLHHLSCLPRKIVQLHGHENVTEFVIHELCHEQCFNLEKAAYFVDNPDFDCLKGVVGYWRAQAYDPGADIWQNPDTFTVHMQSSPFNQKVRGMVRASIRAHGGSDQDIVNAVATDLEIKDPGYSCWNMKNDNHGIFVYEKSGCQGLCSDEDIANGLSLLSLCPVF